METIAFVNGSAAFLTLSWTADDDYLVLGFAGGSSVLSKNPNRTWTNTFSSPTTGVFDEWFVTSDSDLNAAWAFPLKKGEKIYCAMDNAITVSWLLLQRTAELIS
jgi:hypothetical protein